MMQLRFFAGADSWTKGLCQEFSVAVKILGLKSVSEDREIAHFVEITSKDGEGAAGVRKWLSGSSDVQSTELTELAKGHLMGVVMANGCRVCASLIESNLASFVSSADTEADCTVGYKLFLNNDGVPALLNRLSSGGVGYEVTEISQLTEDLRLTTRQFGVLKSAMELGLYDYPRRITQDELAARLGIRSSTLNEILRRAEKKILGGFLGEQVEPQP